MNIIFNSEGNNMLAVSTECLESILKAVKELDNVEDKIVKIEINNPSFSYSLCKVDAETIFIKF